MGRFVRKALLIVSRSPIPHDRFPILPEFVFVKVCRVEIGLGPAPPDNMIEDVADNVVDALGVLIAVYGIAAENFSKTRESLFCFFFGGALFLKLNDEAEQGVNRFFRLQRCVIRF